MGIFAMLSEYVIKFSVDFYVGPSVLFRHIMQFCYFFIYVANVNGFACWSAVSLSYPQIRANDSLQSFKSQLKTYYFWL